MQGIISYEWVQYQLITLSPSVNYGEVRVRVPMLNMAEKRGRYI